MASRVLKPTPSCTEDLQPWQLTLADKLSQLHQECFEKRKALTKTIQEFPALRGVDAVNEIAFAARVACDTVDISSDRKVSFSQCMCPLPFRFQARPYQAFSFLLGLEQ